MSRPCQYIYTTTQYVNSFSSDTVFPHIVSALEQFTPLNSFRKNKSLMEVNLLQFTIPKKNNYSWKYGILLPHYCNFSIILFIIQKNENSKHMPYVIEAIVYEIQPRKALKIGKKQNMVLNKHVCKLDDYLNFNNHVGPNKSFDGMK